MLDLLCYGEKSYKLWLSEVEGLAVGSIVTNSEALPESQHCTDVFCNISVTSAEFEV